MNSGATLLAALEWEAIRIIRGVVAEARNPITLFSGGKHTKPMAHPTIRAFFTSKPLFPDGGS